MREKNKTEKAPGIREFDSCPRGALRHWPSTEAGQRQMRDRRESRRERQAGAHRERNELDKESLRQAAMFKGALKGGERKRKALKKEREELRRVGEENAKGPGGQGDRRELVEKERGNSSL